MTAARDQFLRHIADCDEALTIYDHLSGGAYSADFSLRFVWVAAISSLDSYITDLIIEVASERFDKNLPQEAKLQSETCSFSSALSFVGLDRVRALLHFRHSLSERVRFRSFHYSKDVADGLAFIWNEKGKWDKIAAALGSDAKSVRETLDSIAARRNLIAHSMDFEPSLGRRLSVDRSDAVSIIEFMRQLVDAIDLIVISAN